jgi:tight adherence protein B
MPLRADIARVVATTRAGVSLPEALRRWAASVSMPSADLVVAALALGHAMGGPQAGAIEGVAATLRDRSAVAREVRALGSQARASAVVIVAAPVAFGIVSVLIDPSVLTFLATTPVGAACFATGLALDALGALWMARIIRRGR